MQCSVAVCGAGRGSCRDPDSGGGAGVSGAAAVNGHYEQLRGDLVTTLDLQMQT